MDQRSRRICSLRRLAAAALVLAAGIVFARAGEKIKFDSSVSETVTLPSAARKNQRLQDTSSPAPEKSRSEADLEVPWSPSDSPVVLTPKLGELLDKKKNWMFGGPPDAEDIDPTKRFKSPEFGQARPKGEVERYFERIENQRNGPEKSGRPGVEKPGRLDRTDRSMEELESPNRQFDSPWQSKGSSLLGSRNDSSSGRHLDAGGQPFIQGPALPAFNDPFRSQVSDPVNFQQDATRNALNPITPAKPRLDYLNRPAPAATYNPLDALSVQPTTTYDRARALDSLKSPILGASGLNPISFPRTESVVRAQPPMLEIPKRKF